MNLLRYPILATLVTAMSCASENRSTEGDRQLHYQNYGAAQQIQNHSTDPKVLVPAVDIEKNSKTLLKNQGMPENPRPYSTENSAASRKQSDKDHSTSWLTMVGLTFLGTVLPIAANRFVPGLGNVISNILGGAMKSKGMRLNEANMAGAEQFMRAHPEMAPALVEYLTRAQKKFGVDSFAGKILEHVKSNVLPTIPTRRVDSDTETAAPPPPRVPGA